jgi:hypothetical protein
VSIALRRKALDWWVNNGQTASQQSLTGDPKDLRPLIAAEWGF